jgi:tRNA-Thr(GGU) m(6)t(6)A37 methyltransferase TsaA
MTDPRRGPHPANTLNELPGEEWLYFTKSLLTTAYPSELGHRARRAHGANKPPRLMARLIEFFSRTGDIVLDPFAGVGGTLLGAAISRGPRRAIGIELDPRWAAGLKDIERCTHLVVLYWMDKARRDLAVQVPAHLGKGRGSFALRSPVRPNPIAMSVVKLVKVDGARLEVVAMDCLDGTPLIDIKPYYASTDSIPDAVTGA